MLLQNAVKAKRLIKFNYDGLYRLVEPHAVGLNKSGSVVVRGYQIGGQSSSGGLGWKLFNMDKAEDVQLDYLTFDEPRPGYAKNDRAMASILAQV